MFDALHVTLTAVCERAVGAASGWDRSGLGQCGDVNDTHTDRTVDGLPVDTFYMHFLSSQQESDRKNLFAVCGSKEHFTSFQS